jgi:hypothetical protein
MHVAKVRDKSNAYTVLVEKHLRKQSLVRPRRRWEDNIKMDFRETEQIRNGFS